MINIAEFNRDAEGDCKRDCGKSERAVKVEERLWIGMSRRWVWREEVLKREEGGAAREQEEDTKEQRNWGRESNVGIKTITVTFNTAESFGWKAIRGVMKMRPRAARAWEKNNASRKKVKSCLGNVQLGQEGNAWWSNLRKIKDDPREIWVY